VEQRIGENFNVALNFTYFDIEKYTTERTGGSAASVYRDIKPDAAQRRAESVF